MAEGKSCLKAGSYSYVKRILGCVTRLFAASLIGLRPIEVTLNKFSPMRLKKLLALAVLSLPMFVFGQIKPFDYDARWKVVDSLFEKKGLPGSALAEVNRIYAAAQKERNDPQAIKALVYQFRLVEAREGADTMVIKRLDSAVAGARQPAKSILQSLLATAYLQYYSRNQWQLRDRTTTVNFVKRDISIWGADDFSGKISSLYLASLKEEQLLLGTSLEGLSPLISKGNVRFLRPTLFDLLAHQALDYFKRTDRNLNKPADVFEIDDPAAFGDAAVFSQHRFKTSDTGSLEYKALGLYQRLIAKHLGDARPDALIDADIDRVQFVYSRGVMDDKETLYMRALGRITDRYGDNPTAATAWYLQAAWLAYPSSNIRRRGPMNGSAANGGDSTRYDNRKAKAICERVVAQKDSSEGKESCRILLKELTEKRVETEVEQVNLPGKPFRALVKWSNTSRVYFRIVNLDKALDMISNYNEATYKKAEKLAAMPAYRQFDKAVPEPGDYRMHSVEVAIGALPTGTYALVACADPSWNTTGVLSFNFFYVSAISFVNKGRDFFVLNRETGQPLAGAKVQFWTREYNSRTSSYDLIKSDAYQTDNRGYFRQEIEKKQQDLYKYKALEVTTANDHLFLRDISIPYYDIPVSVSELSEEKTIEENTREFLFADRSIYRPGQTIYFKGIAVTKGKEDKEYRPRAGMNGKVRLYNANNDLVDSIDIKTNEYGSYHGSFRLPEGQLNGSFRISTENGEVSFSVEEYKRPSFYVDYDKQTGSYRVGDSIHVTGNAKAYAGNVLDGATVKYRVVRRARYPHPWLFWKIGYPGTSEKEIKHGEIKTDGKGGFYLSFPAVPDRSLDRKLDPQFEYSISADVTDINGETRSAGTTVVAGYTVLNLAIEAVGGDHQAADSLKELRMKVTNLAGEPVESKVQVVVYGLRSPERLVRERLWSRPEKSGMSEKEFLDSFPRDEYKEELLKESWERGGVIWEGAGTTARETGAGGAALQIPSGKLKTGWYLVEAKTTDKYGQEVKDLHYIELFDGKTGQPASPQYNWALGGEEQTMEPGGKARVETGSSVSNVFVIRNIERSGKPEDAPREYSLLTINQEKKSNEFAITEADRGGMGVSDVFVKDNRIFIRKQVIRVPWTNKQLQIRYGSYRDKTKPGSEEKWSVTISGQQKDKVSAEVLAGMYDASLDQFASHGWNIPSLYGEFDGGVEWEGRGFGAGVGNVKPAAPQWDDVRYTKTYDQLIGLGDFIRYGNMRPMAAGRVAAAPGFSHDMNPDLRTMEYSVNNMLEGKVAGVAIKQVTDGEKEGDSAGKGAPEAAQAQVQVQVRKNFNETAFFFPDLHTDAEGNVTFSFKMPEALTRWKWMTLAQTKDLSFGYSEKTVVTQKELMVQPNAPRFLREGDHMDLAVKVVNLTDSEMTGQLALQLTDPTTGETADGWFTNRQPNQYFTVAAGGSAVVSFPLVVPFQYNRPVTYRVVAQARSFSDGEEATLPVVSNRMLVTETLPLNMKGDGTKKFSFDKLLQSGGSETLNHHALTVEFTANPTWYAVQSLPYLMEFPYECAEQTFNRFYANALASRIVTGSPRLREVFNRWKTEDTAALLSNLQKNQELKSVLLEETPWVLQGKSESQQKKNVAMLFDMSRMGKELSGSLEKIMAMQLASGGFAWFKGGYDDVYITQYILTGIGRLQKLKAIPAPLEEKVKMMVKDGLAFVDGQVRKRYEEALKVEKGRGVVGISALDVQYLYLRSFFAENGIPGQSFAAVNYFRKKAQKDWTQSSKYMQGMIALALYRTGDVQTAKDIIKSLRQFAIVDEEMGMYWKGMEGGYYWYEAPVEMQSLFIEAFREISGDKGVDRDLKTWLLKQKQTHNWRTTKATADACYALLLGGEDWLNVEREVKIQLGEKEVSWGMGAAGAASGTAGTGYYKKVFDGPFVSPSMGNITVTMQGSGAGGQGAGARAPAWGAVYWQYFDMLDRITPPGASKAPLKVGKKLFIERITDKGRVLEPVVENGVLKPGDKVVVRIELRADRDMEYVHMKDMRAACMEPVNVISQYKWQDGLGYYESTKDASTDFFFSYVRKGVYVFEYPLRVGQSGNFSNGITTVECMYAPEFAYHSEGIRVSVEGN